MSRALFCLNKFDQHEADRISFAEAEDYPIADYHVKNNQIPVTGVLRLDIIFY